MKRATIRACLAWSALAAAAWLPAAAQDRPTDTPEDVPASWAVRLGQRSLQVQCAFPLIDRVVLVPDAATYLDELSKWSPQGRWPVLIEDARLSAMFIRRFQPAEVVRRDSIGSRPITRQAIENLTITSFGGQPETHDLHQALTAHRFEPAGIVVASLDDPAWPAAAALAAGRGQPVVWIDRFLGEPNDVMDRAQADELAESIRHSLESLNWSYADLGDAIDTITICRTMAGGVQYPRPDKNRHEPVAITDYLGRHERAGRRYAFTGWIFGDEIRSSYMAMCSLFLPRTYVTMYDTYGRREGDGWKQYDMTAATAVLSEHGCEVTHLNGRRTNEAGWLGMVADGLRTDLLVMNSSGNQSVMDVHGGRVWPCDVPLLDTPVALHLTHSWSLRSPNDANTVGGRWLDRGAYAYVGSMHEPYLSAFHPPTVLAQRWVKRVPLLVAARYWSDQPQPFSGPWKINTIGDPLMTFPPPMQVQDKPQRVQQPAGYGVNLHEQVQQMLLAVRDQPTPALIAETMSLLALLGRDDIALPLWKIAQPQLAQSTNGRSDAARAALGTLHRAREVEAFMLAWSWLDHRDEEATDMLWHLLTPRLDMLDEQELLQMQAAVRPAAAEVDLRRLAPHLAEQFGADHARSVIQSHLDQAHNEAARRSLQELLEQYE